MVGTSQRTEQIVQTQVNGITFAYNDRGSGLPIIFLHAFPLNRTMWAEQEN